MALPLKWVPRLFRWLAPYRRGSQEAADQYLGKKSKVATLDDLVQVRDYQELAEADREGVAALRKKHGFAMGTTGGKAGDRDTFACDDMTINASRSGVLEMLAGLAIGAAGCWFFADRLNPSPAPVDATATAEAEFRFWQRKADGTLVPVDIERLPPEMRKATP